jgi:branched-chain amino acid transport system ATP-binding protein
MLLEISKLAVAYGDVQALWGVSLDVGPGEIVVLIGSNGAGKSTLMRTIAGLQRPMSGGINFDGAKLHTLQPHVIVEHGIVLVPEGRRLFGGMTVVENLEMGAFTPKARSKRVETMERVFEVFPVLSNRRHQRAQTMSGGEQQMLAIGRAMMGLPRLLMLDEPSLGLAPLVVQNIFEVIRAINRQGVTVLLVEQNARAALELADRAYIIEQGRVVGSGTGVALLHDNAVREAYLGYGPS